MIPRADLINWQQRARWDTTQQVEQDLILSRAMVEMFSDDRASDLLAVRGGTALHKIHLAPATRYSEDIDLVQLEPGPAAPFFDVIRDNLDPWLGKPKVRQKRNGVQVLYRFETEVEPRQEMRLKVEVNTREHFNEMGFVSLPFAVENPWFTGTASVRTYRLEELLGTKLRALYQRKKGRDLFDLWHALERGVEPADVVRCFHAYLEAQGLRVSRAEFEANLLAKLEADAFDDIRPLLVPGLDYDPERAAERVLEGIIQRL